jgi:hypothetical protein
MRKTCLLLLFAALVFHAIGADTIPAELVGEWATDQSQFDGGGLTNGIAVYLNTNGAAAMFAAPPPMGKKWRATYDITNRVLTMSLGPQPGEGLPHGLTFRFTYDPKTGTLLPNNGLTRSILKHRQDHVPKGLMEGLE